VASQLDQLLGYLDRPGVTEVALCPGKPITMTTPKGVINVTGRSLTFDQLASIVRGTPIEALVADEAASAEPVLLALGGRDITIVIERRGESPTVRLQKSEIAKPRTRTKPKAGGGTSPPSDKLKPPAMPAPKLDEPINLDDMLLPPGSAMPPSPLDELPRPRSSSIAPPMPTGPHPNDMRPRSNSMSPFAGLPLTTPSAPIPVLPASGSVPLPGLTPLPGLAPAPESELPVPPPRSSGNKLRIDVSAMAEPPPSIGRDASGIITLERGPSTPLARDVRTLDALGLPSDLGRMVGRERSLVVITAPHGHGKTSTLAALCDVIDRASVAHVITIDELRDRESVDFAITAAETGYLVIATITAPTPAAAIDRIVDHYPGMAHGRVRTRLIGSVGAVICKRLPPTPSEIVTGPALRILLGD